MSPIRMDLSNVGTGFELVPDGDYPAHIFKVEETKTTGGKNPGSPMLKVQYKLDNGAGSVFDNIVLVPESAWKFKQLCVAAGISEDRLGADTEVELVELMGQPVIVTVGTKPATQQYAAANNIKRVHNPDTYTGDAPQSGAQGWD